MSDDDLLSDYFSAARGRPPVPSDALLRRVAESGARAQDLAQSAAVASAAPRGWRSWLADFGGWAAAAAMVASVSVGFVIGLSQPEVVFPGSSVLADADTELETAIFPTVDGLFEQEG